MAKFSVTFNEDLCKSCELCVVACPKGLIELNRESSNASGYNIARIKDMEACIGCKSCAKMCPDSAIVIKK